MIAPPSPSTLSVMEWISLTPTELMRRGVEPKHRAHYTGHNSNLIEAWLPSIGNWAVINTNQFVNNREPEKGLVRVRYNAYRQYRHRHGLLTASEFELIHGECRVRRPWFWAELCWTTYRVWEEEMFAINGGTHSLGRICQDIYLASRFAADPVKRIGMLPVEIVLWTRLFRAFVGTLASYEDWEVLEDDDKTRVWEEGYRGKPWCIGLVAHVPAIAQLRPLRRLAQTG